MSALKGNKEIAISGKQKESKRGKVTQSSSLAPRPQTQDDGKRYSKGKSPMGRSPSGKRCQRPYRNDLNGKLYEPVHVIFGILPNVNIINQNRDANSVKSACSGTKRLTVSLTNDRKRMVEKVLLPHCRIPSNEVAYSRMWSRRNPSRFYGRTQNSWDECAACNSRKGHDTT